MGKNWEQIREDFDGCAVEIGLYTIGLSVQFIKLYSDFQ